MKSRSIALLPFALAACATMQPPTDSLDAPGGAAGPCDATEAQQFLGETADEALGKVILDRSGARTLRWGGRDTAFTMDFREDRVNVIYDDRGIVERIYCG